MVKSKCIGCAVCVAGCPEDDAIALGRRPEQELNLPPKTLLDWMD